MACPFPRAARGCAASASCSGGGLSAWALPGPSAYRRDVVRARTGERADMAGVGRGARKLGPLLLLAACARGPVVIEEAPEPVVCRHGPDCQAKWHRVHDWVVAHSRWPIRQDTDALLATD